MRCHHPLFLHILVVCTGAALWLSPAWSQETGEADPIEQLAAIASPLTWSADVHMMVHIGPYTIDMTGDLAANHNLVKARLLSGVGGQMIFVKVYTGADGIQWTELSSPPRNKEVVKLDLNRVEEATDGALGLNLLERLDGSSTLGINMGDIWRGLLDRFGEDLKVERAESESGDVFQISLFFSEETYAIIDPAGELRKENVTPTVMLIEVGADDGLMRYMALLTSEEQFSFELILKNFQIDPEVDPADFEYTPPDGIEPKDITDQAIAELTGVPIEEEVEDFRLIY